MNDRTKADDKAAGYSLAMIVSIIVACSIGDLWPENRPIYGTAILGLIVSGVIMSALLTKYFKRFPELNAQADSISETSERVIRVERNALLILLAFVIAAVFVFWLSENRIATSAIAIGGFIARVSYEWIYTKKAYQEASS